MRLERAAIRDLGRVLDGQLQQVLRDLRIGKTVDEVLAGLAVRPELRAAIEGMLLRAIDLGVIGAEATLGVGIDWTLANIAARDWASQYSYQLVTGINDTTRRVLQKAVARRIETGMPLKELVKELSPYFGKRRASLLASTETTRAYATANLEAFRQNGTEYVRWNTANDELVCPRCAPLNGVIITLGNGFPGGFLHPPAHPRCRCWITPSQGASNATRVGGQRYG